MVAWPLNAQIKNAELYEQHGGLASARITPMTFNEWYSLDAPPEDFEGRFAQMNMARAAWDAAIEEAAKVCDEQAKEHECPERAAYCAEAVRMLGSNMEHAETCSF